MVKEHIRTDLFHEISENTRTNLFHEIYENTEIEINLMNMTDSNLGIIEINNYDQNLVITDPHAIMLHNIRSDIRDRFFDYSYQIVQSVVQCTLINLPNTIPADFGFSGEKMTEWHEKIWDYNEMEDKCIEISNEIIQIINLMFPIE